MNEIEVGQYFDTASESYTHEKSVEEINSWPIVDEFIADLSSEGDRLLEIGCGDGLLLEYALNQTDVTGAYGLDLSTTMLPDPNDAVQARYVQGSATDLPLPFEPESFDFVVMSDVLHHLVGANRSQSKLKAQAALIGAVNLLKEGGHLVVKDIYHQSHAGPDKLLPYAIFYGLKYFVGIASAIDEEATPGLLVSFYTSDELVEMLQQAGTTVVKEEAVSRGEPKTVVRRALIGESTCIRLYARKQSRQVERAHCSYNPH